MDQSALSTEHLTETTIHEQLGANSRACADLRNMFSEHAHHAILDYGRSRAAGQQPARVTESSISSQKIGQPDGKRSKANPMADFLHSPAVKAGETVMILAEMREQVQRHREAASHHPELNFQRSPPGTLQLLRNIEADRKKNAESQAPHKHTANLTVIVLSYVDLVCFTGEVDFPLSVKSGLGL